MLHRLHSLTIEQPWRRTDELDEIYSIRLSVVSPNNFISSVPLISFFAAAGAAAPQPATVSI
jgi:hypothetical protein